MLTLTTAAQATATPTVTATPEPSATPRPTDPPPPPIPVPEWEYGLDACALAGSETAEVIFGEMASEPSSSFGVDYNDPAYTFTCTYQTDRYAAYLYIWIARTVESATARYDLYREAAGPEAIDPGAAGQRAGLGQPRSSSPGSCQSRARAGRRRAEWAGGIGHH